MAIRRLVDHMAAGIANICYLYNPDMVIISGSLAAQMRYVRPLLMGELKKDSDPWYMNIRASPLLIWEKRQP